MNHTTLNLLEEIFNSITHGIGAVASSVGLVFLILLTKNAGVLKLSSFIIFGASLLCMYLMSTLFHSLTFTKAKKVFLILDRSAIFLLIAGTYTPFALLILHGTLHWFMLGLIWSLAICGIVFNAIFSEKYKLLYVPIYVVMGWIGLFIIKPLLATASMNVVWLLLIGGLLYTTGIIFYYWSKLPFNHSIWHIFVMGGSFCHFLMIYSL